jgi:tetratricopeptide (TPR) repeat protein
MELEQDAAGAVRTGAAERALTLADRAVLVSPASPRAHYERALALQALGRDDEAVQAYREAERRFGDRNAQGTARAIYGRARALTDAGRCAEARIAYQEYADFARAFDAVSADRALAYARDCREARSPAGERAASEAASALIGGDYRGALEVAGAVPASQVSPWLEYDRAVALGELGRTDEAVAAFASAEARFGDDETSRHGRAVAIYGRARVLAKAGRCPEARRACAEYSSFASVDGERCRSC